MIALSWVPSTSTLRVSISIVLEGVVDTTIVGVHRLSSTMSPQRRTRSAAWIALSTSLSCSSNRYPATSTSTLSAFSSC